MLNNNSFLSELFCLYSHTLSLTRNHLGVGLEVTLTPPVLTVFEGEDAIFTCSPLIPIAVPLLEQDEFVVTGEGYPRISFVDNTGLGFSEGNRTYTLREVERRDNGTEFRCSVAGVQSNIVTLTVYSKCMYYKSQDFHCKSGQWQLRKSSL